MDGLFPKILKADICVRTATTQVLNPNLRKTNSSLY